MKVISETESQSYFGIETQIPLEFYVNGLIVTPDDGSVSYTIRSSATNIIVPDTAIPSGETVIKIPATDNNKVSDEVYAARFVTIAFTEDGHPKTRTLQYTLIDFLPLTISAQTIRDILGVSDEELPDNAINFYSSYRKLNSALGINIFEDETKLYESNELLKSREALTQGNLLYLKVLQRNKVDDHAKQRSTIMDFRSLINSLEADYIRAYTVFDDSAPVDTLLQFGQSRTDPITG